MFVPASLTKIAKTANPAAGEDCSFPQDPSGVPRVRDPNVAAPTELSTTIQTWEYRTIKVGTKGMWGGILDTSSFDALLNQLGSEGWELVTAFGTNLHNGASREAIAVFKRPRH